MKAYEAGPSTVPILTETVGGNLERTAAASSCANALIVAMQAHTRSQHGDLQSGTAA
ncbi:hypothetical protein O6P37_08510 [Mycobacterium sp. CPCC 205372]|uniref:Uncharacterized protein n=1 Tax=Mycobacterium hippophais TaxID=3016340 RepID=A0ABT4PQQ9_9MYCO|nr:hypothetical protein [Mycobacterium hippophais]MCZ8378898.1 hypothetical protein [Mycobacterium hippophais]